MNRIFGDMPPVVKNLIIINAVMLLLMYAVQAIVGSRSECHSWSLLSKIRQFQVVADCDTHVHARRFPSPVP